MSRLQQSSTISQKNTVSRPVLPLFEYYQNGEAGLRSVISVSPDTLESTPNKVLYNEFSRFPLGWLRELGAAGAIPAGAFDGRSIQELQAEDLVDFDIVHFFAGVGVWAHALEQAGWPRSGLRTWTGSLPCQPFSRAGQKLGFLDERHLWPKYFELIELAKPSVLLGEQVAGKDGLAWFDVVRTDLEKAGYAVGAVDFPAAGVGSPQRRQRLYWTAARMGDAAHIRSQLLGSGRPESARWKEQAGDGSPSRSGRATAGFWRDVEWVDCADGKRRPLESGLCTLADRSPAGVDALRGFGNACNSECAIAFTVAVREALAGLDGGEQGLT